MMRDYEKNNAVRQQYRRRQTYDGASIHGSLQDVIRRSPALDLRAEPPFGADLNRGRHSLSAC